MNESELYERFKTLSLPAGEFKHEDHLRLAWYLSGQYALTEAIERLVTGLKRFAKHAGVPELYHETITLFYFYEICARRQLLDKNHDWQDFRMSNPDLFVSHREFMGRHYSENVLRSPVAKSHFIPPG